MREEKINCDISQCGSREMNFEEEAALFEKEANKLFAKEDRTCEPSFEICVIRRGMRIIMKAREEQERLNQSFKKFTQEMQTEIAPLRKELEKYNLIKAVADKILGGK